VPDVLSNVLEVTTEPTPPGGVALSGILEVTTAPPRPTDLTEEGKTADSITIGWTDQTAGEHWHRVYFQLASEDPETDPWEVGAEVAPATVQAEVGGLEGSTEYRWTATAFDGAAESGFATAILVTTEAGDTEGAEGTGALSGAGQLAGVGAAILSGSGSLSGTGTLSGIGQAPITGPAEGTGTISGGGSIAGIGEGEPEPPPPPLPLMADLTPDLMARII
jgi:hypothetical protein